MSIFKEEDLKLRYVEIIRQSSRKKFQSCGAYISNVNHEGKSLKVAVCVHHMSIFKEMYFF